MPNCPSCDNVEMIATDRGNTRECPICGYAEPHEASSSNARPNRAARRAQKQSQKSPRPRQQRRAATEARNKAIDEGFAKARAENPDAIIMVDELTLGMIHTLDGLGHDQVR